MFAGLLEAQGRREESPAIMRTLKQTQPDDLSNYYSCAFTLADPL